VSRSWRWSNHITAWPLGHLLPPCGAAKYTRHQTSPSDSSTNRGGATLTHVGAAALDPKCTPEPSKMHPQPNNAGPQPSVAPPHVYSSSAPVHQAPSPLAPPLSSPLPHSFYTFPGQESVRHRRPLSAIGATPSSAPHLRLPSSTNLRPNQEHAKLPHTPLSSSALSPLAFLHHRCQNAGRRATAAMAAACLSSTVVGRLLLALAPTLAGVPRLGGPHLDGHPHRNLVAKEVAANQGGYSHAREDRRGREGRRGEERGC
jgi:hypothetical protein